MTANVISEGDVLNKEKRTPLPVSICVSTVKNIISVFSPVQLIAAFRNNGLV